MDRLKYTFTIAVQDFKGERYYSAGRDQLRELAKMTHSDRYKVIVANYPKACIHDTSSVDVHWVDSAACANSAFVSEVNLALGPLPPVSFTAEERELVLSTIKRLTDENLETLGDYGDCPKDEETKRHADVLNRELGIWEAIRAKLGG